MFILNGNGVNISDQCFESCKNLKSIELPKDISYIGYSAFNDCPSLESVIIKNKYARIMNLAFEKSDILTIYSYSGSTAQEYATEYEINFVELKDNNPPEIYNVKGNTTEWTNKDITLEVSASDHENDILEYSFDNGETWQTSNTKTYMENTNGIIIKVKDGEGNIATYEETINIDKIDKIAPTITITPNGSSISENEKIVITVTDTGGSGLSNDNSYQYQLGTSNQEVPTGTWNHYTSGTEFTIGDGLTGDYYLWVRSIEDNAANKASETDYMVSNKFTFNNINEPEIDSEIYIIDEDNAITQILPETNLLDFKNNISTKFDYKIENLSGEEIQESDVIGTGYKLITDANEEYTLIVTGDLNSDGMINLIDLSRTRKYYLKLITLQEEYEKAADTNHDNIVNLADVSVMRKVILELGDL